MPHAQNKTLPSGATIRLVSPPYLLATKLEAFAGRGQEDDVGSRDFADIVSLIDGRSELRGEVASSANDLRAYVADEFARHRRHPRFGDGVAGGLQSDAASQPRAELVVVAVVEANR